jgi:hypothetical protein
METETVLPIPVETVELRTCERVTIGGTSFLRVCLRHAGVDHMLTTQPRTADILRDAAATHPTGALIGAAVAAFLGVKKGAEERVATEILADAAGQVAYAQLQADTVRRLKKLGRRHR